jgi:hypothetical protein
VRALSPIPLPLLAVAGAEEIVRKERFLPARKVHVDGKRHLDGPPPRGCLLHILKNVEFAWG